MFRGHRGEGMEDISAANVAESMRVLSENVEYFNTSVPWYLLVDIGMILNVDIEWLSVEVSESPLFKGRYRLKETTAFINQAGISALGWVLCDKVDMGRYSLLLHAVNKHVLRVMDVLKGDVVESHVALESEVRRSDQLSKEVRYLSSELNDAEALLGFKSTTAETKGVHSPKTQTSLKDAPNALREHIVSIRQEYAAKIDSLEREICRLRPESLTLLLSRYHKRGIRMEDYYRLGLEGIRLFLEHCEIPISLSNVVKSLAKLGVLHSIEGTILVSPEYMHLLPDSVDVRYSRKCFEFLLFLVARENQNRSNIVNYYFDTYNFNQITDMPWIEEWGIASKWESKLPELTRIPSYEPGF